MALKTYQSKRSFSKTPEPKGKAVKTELSRFVIQKHQASNLHYDFRLEMKGVLKSWAVPKNLSKVIGEKRLGVETEDHPIDYIDFAGEIPLGNYGAGTVKIWDKGKFKIISQSLKSMKIEHFINTLVNKLI